MLLELVMPTQFMSCMCFLVTVMSFVEHGCLRRGTVCAVAKHLGRCLHQVKRMPKTGISLIKRRNLSIRQLSLLDDLPDTGHVHPTISEVSDSAARAVAAFLEPKPMQEVATVLQATRHCSPTPV